MEHMKIQNMTGSRVHKCSREEAVTDALRKLETKVDDLLEGGLLYDSSLTLGMLAVKAAVNRSYMSLFFRKVKGTGFPAYVAGRRIAKALSLLVERETDGSYRYTLDDIVVLCGFSDRRSLYRAMSRFAHSTPWQYRKGYRRNI